jgi:hypothetical protein
MSHVLYKLSAEFGLSCGSSDASFMSGMPVTTGLSARTRYLTTGGAAGIWLLRVAQKILHR